MARHYSPKNFLRQAPNALLVRYFQEKNPLAEVDFSALSETNIGPIYEAWDNLPSETRQSMESDFRNIDALACETGIKALIDAAQEEGEDLEPTFAEMDGFYDKAFWSFFEKESFFELALLYVNADNLPTRYWRRRKDLPKLPALKDEASLRELGEAFAIIFARLKAGAMPAPSIITTAMAGIIFSLILKTMPGPALNGTKAPWNAALISPPSRSSQSIPKVRAPWTFSSMWASRPCVTCR